jgi:hypothetical protein
MPNRTKTRTVSGWRFGETKAGAETGRRQNAMERPLAGRKDRRAAHRYQEAKG